MELCHQNITYPVVTSEDCILHGLTMLTDDLKDDPTAQSDAKRKYIADLHDASNIWADPNEILDPSVPIPRPTPAQTRHAMKILERNLKHPATTHQTTPRVPIKLARFDPAPRQTIHQHVSATYPRVNPKDTPPAVQPISRRTRSHTQNTQPPIALCTRSQLQQALKVTPYQLS